MAAQARQRPDDNPVVIWEAQPRQSAFISCPADDVGFGGARGGGKSDAVVGDWVSHEDLYGQHAIGLVLRRERTQLIELIERCRAVLPLLGHKWHEQDKFFRGPKGGRLRFAYCERDADADAYQGHSYTRLYPEEMGTFPSEAPINKLQATLRSGNGVPCQMKGTCNPGGPGHQWVKARYRLDTHPKGFEVFRFEFVNPFTKAKIEKTRVFIPSKVSDNKFLGDDYVANLFQVGSQQLVRAWLEGDWSVIEGAFFDGWSTERHVVRPFEIPKDWIRIRSMDWGFARPFSVGWWAVVSEPYRTETVTLPRGCMVRYREWYGSSSPNVGLRLTAEEVAKGIRQRERVDEHIALSVLDPSAFKEDGGPSIAERMMSSHKVIFRPADNTRVAKLGAISGWDAVRTRLKGDADGPMIACFSTCVDSIRTIPVLQHDTLKPEDLDTEGEDHCFAGQTLVDTDTGPVKIRDLVRVKHRVWSAGKWRDDFWARMTSPNAELMRLRFNNGRVIMCTPLHKFMDCAGEWRYAKDLLNREVACDQQLLARQSKSSWANAFTSAACIFSGRAGGFTARFGKRTSRLSQTDGMSIIRMVTVPTIRQTIWNAWRPKHTWVGHTVLKAVCAAVAALSERELRQLNGMVASAARNGMPLTTISASGLSWPKGLTPFASNAVAHTRLLERALSRANSAEITVAPVRCVSVEPAGKGPTYCIDEPETRAFTIEGGFIVHNCADEWRYACLSRPWVPRRAEEVKGKTMNQITLNELWKLQRKQERRI